jgi:hypothetical protein
MRVAKRKTLTSIGAKLSARQNKISCMRCAMLLAPLLLCWLRLPAQIVPYYPPEIWFGLIGYTNSIPGCPSGLYAPFSSVRTLLQQDLPSVDPVGLTLYFRGSYERYLHHTDARDYHPLSLDTRLRLYVFANDIFTPGVEIIGNLDAIPGLSEQYEIQNIRNSRLRCAPYHYLVPHPNIIIKEYLSFGKSWNSLPSNIRGTMIYNDRSIILYGMRVIYLSPFHTRFFIEPYLFRNQYEFLPARSSDASFSIDNPKLREQGAGIDVGFKYYNFRWGNVEGVFELEKNDDMIYSANDYYKFKASGRWENQYFTRIFGYKLRFEYARHISDNTVFSTSTADDPTGELAKQEWVGDIEIILNLNRNVSFRPQYDVLYRESSVAGQTIKSRYWLNIHVILSRRNYE